MNVMETHTPGETRAAGKAFARRLKPGDIVLLEGPLGSGKTTFVQGMAEELGGTVFATSPSFTLLHEYLLAGQGVLRHLDLYRLTDPAVDLDRIGLSELLEDPRAITVIEWADRLPKGMLSSAVRVARVRITHGKEPAERVIETG
ncbi:MAG: UPF0079 ATP-binding protein [Parcubacteria group bacterium Gr01-1014_106]|nr:MAG: UPF0079 ATP-binding protein [Parcubacteria group bacterium Gr01-1014_106]